MSRYSDRNLELQFLNGLRLSCDGHTKRTRLRWTIWLMWFKVKRSSIFAISKPAARARHKVHIPIVI